MALSTAPVAPATKARPDANVRNIMDTLKDIQDACTQCKEDILKGKVYLSGEATPFDGLSKLVTELSGYDKSTTGKARAVPVNPTEPVE